ncbi:hypothetical protein GCM10023149_30870 [Mucilaginibacter gynuensis]|uniref:Lipoprotein n=1 Tax=Mucilaginibacter gynuensis TaxID=1302236 RepID=A0ABP8GNT6_9SPHI
MRKTLLLALAATFALAACTKEKTCYDCALETVNYPDIADSLKYQQVTQQIPFEQCLREPGDLKDVTKTTRTLYTVDKDTIIRNGVVVDLVGGKMISVTRTTCDRNNHTVK